MATLYGSLNKVFSESFILYFRAHVFHWNVVGPNFAQYHAFFGALYEETWKSLDPIAEHIRALDYLAPSCLNEVLVGVTENRHHTPGTTIEMFEELAILNNNLLIALKDARREAENSSEYGIVNYLEGLIDAHDKWKWQIRAFL